MLETFVAQVARCATVNQMQRLIISLEMILAPGEVARLAADVRARGIGLPDVVAKWLDRMEELIRRDGAEPENYVRQSLTEGATFYAAPGAPAERAARTLVLAFTGDAHRLMMPIALFLQNCPASRYELLVAYDAAHAFYLRGIPGLGDTLPATLARLAAMVPPSRYRRAVSFGTSAGGLAAVWAAVALGLDRGVSVGGVTPSEVERRVQTQDLSTDEFDAAIRRCEGRLPQVLLVHGEGAERDARKAHEMSEIVPAQRIAVPGCMDHNVLYELWKRHELRALLDRALGDGAAAAAPGPDEPSSGSPPGPV